MAMTVADYVLRGKAALGDPHMSDREFGKEFGVTASTISNARYYGTLSDNQALKLAALLKIDAGEILLVARAEREKPGPVKNALMAYLKKVLASVPSKSASALAACAVALRLLMPAPDVPMHVGGEGGIRTLDTV
jgi:hypothetical protein